MEIIFREGNADEIEKLANSWHEEYEKSKGIEYGYKKFYIIAKEREEIIGILTGCTAYSGICINNLIVSKNHRGQGIGKSLLEKLENQFKDKGFDFISLLTNEFQAPEFYQRCGYTLEFVRKNKKNPAFNKYFFVKWLE